MTSRSDLPLPTLVLAAAGFVLVAPVLGRSGHPAAADLAMAAAAICGVTSFVIAGLSTLRAARRDGQTTGREEGRS